ncbi:VCBS repeat-containing protein [Mariniflexile litorale]|uniref:VCBS repeat-containing protein n=1 Tax=Mariniflexile litorale TaxID=3045158 RepID=A0AAU7EGX1_9FLAO|nr:VCBS repeat-containing protein [Mariniflexile sp. KMM 9835]MDQ8211924.1 VCBS repeat-containing protein [Mariniflexile sp. KMM 9835]
MACSNLEEKDIGFSLVPSSKSGINFQNNVEETDTFNFLKYIYFYNGAGVAAGDLNGDGLDDLYFTANMELNKLYLNKGDLTFEDITEYTKMGGSKDTWYTGVTFVDINGDGRLDIYLSQIGEFVNTNGRNQLYINYGNDKNGYPIFKEEASKYGLNLATTTTQTAFFDYDLDGDLDAYFLNHSDYNKGIFGPATQRKVIHPIGDKLFRNDNNTFVDVTEESGLYSSLIGYGLGISVADINDDGYPDIYVGNDFHEDDYLYINNQDGTFSESLEKYMGHTSRFSMGTDIADINNDGLPDIMSLDMLAEDPQKLRTSQGEDSYPIFHYKLKFGYGYQYARNALQLNNGNETFSDIALFSGVAATDWSWSVLINDYDLDGSKDIFIANGIYRRSNDMDYMKYISNNSVKKNIKSGEKNIYKDIVSKMPSDRLGNYLYQNQNDFTFKNKASEWGLDAATFSNGSIHTDLDNDGDLDLVINNLNETAQVYENRIRNNNKDEIESPNYLKIALKGNKQNLFGIGTKVYLKYQGNIQFQEMMSVRGYMSSPPAYLTFGLGSAQKVDSVIVEWMGKKRQVLTDVAVNQKIQITEDEASEIIEEKIEKQTLFKDITNKSDIHYKHQENRFFEFNRERLMPHMVSAEGPSIVVADVNNDGKEDFFVTGARGQASTIYKQTNTNKFVDLNQTVFAKDSLSEDVGAAFFDADGDKDVDLLVVTGGNQDFKNIPQMMPRLYMNDGKGNFSKSKNLPEIHVTASCVKACDYDKDGDVDAFIGGRAIPVNYGGIPKSYLLNNNGKGDFEEVQNTSLQDVGMVTEAIWTDLNGDQWTDLVIVGEWMPITIFINKEGRLIKQAPENIGLDISSGLWNTVVAEDFDGDGDLDLIAGNLGLNSKLRASVSEPVQMYVDDFDHNTWKEPIITHYVNGEEFPFARIDELQKQLSYLSKKFNTYAQYSTAKLNDIFPKEQLLKAKHFEVQELRSMYIENLGNGKFKMKPLPNQVQFTTSNALLPLDYNNDGHKDVLVGGNFYEVNVQFGRYDAGYGYLLKGLGDGTFVVEDQQKMGFLLNNQVRDLQSIQLSDNQEGILVAKNNENVKLFIKSKE